MYNISEGSLAMIVEYLYSLNEHTLNKSSLRFTGIDLYSG